MSYRSWGKKETFKIGNNVYTHDILIVEIEGMSGIVSLDFLMKYDGKMHFKDNCLQLRNEMVHLIPESKAFFCARIRMCDSVIIPPNTEMFIEGRIKGNFCQDTAIIEPKKVVHKKAY